MESGSGEFDYQNGYTYTGAWERTDSATKRQGYGTLTRVVPTANGASLTEEYTGYWHNDLMQGQGQFKYLSGAVYVGQWEQGKQHGEGTYRFPNGALYSGQWQRHRMHGAGTYVDPKGVEWEGIFIEGGYDSTIQEELRTQHTIRAKVQELKGTVTEALNEFKKVFSTEKKLWKEAFSKCLATEEAEEHVSEPFPRWEERNGDKWNDLVAQLLDVEPHVLCSQDDVEFLSSTRVLSAQLSGPGQVVEVSKRTDNRRTELGLVQGKTGKWFIFHSLDTVQKA